MKSVLCVVLAVVLVLAQAWKPNQDFDPSLIALGTGTDAAAAPPAETAPAPVAVPAAGAAGAPTDFPWGDADTLQDLLSQSQLTGQQASAVLPQQQAITNKIQQASALLTRVEQQVNREIAWAQNVHDVIQNYQYKYKKVLADIKLRSQKADKLRNLVDLLKKAQLHNVIEDDLAKATDELGALTEGQGEGSAQYQSLKERVESMKSDLAKLSKDSVDSVLDSIDEKILEATADPAPRSSQDTLRELASEDDDAASTTGDADAAATASGAAAPAAAAAAPPPAFRSTRRKHHRRN